MTLVVMVVAVGLIVVIVAGLVAVVVSMVVVLGVAVMRVIVVDLVPRTMSVALIAVRVAEVGVLVPEAHHRHRSNADHHQRELERPVPVLLGHRNVVLAHQGAPHVVGDPVPLSRHLRVEHVHHRHVDERAGGDRVEAPLEDQRRSPLEHLPRHGADDDPERRHDREEPQRPPQLPVARGVSGHDQGKRGGPLVEQDAQHHDQYGRGFRL